MAPFAAALMNKYGVRRIVLIAQAIVAACLITSLWMTSLWQLLLLWGVGVGIGTGMTALVLGATVATRWFVARRGLVVGVLTASVATGQLIFLPLSDVACRRLRLARGADGRMRGGRLRGAGDAAGDARPAVRCRALALWP